MKPIITFFLAVLALSANAATFTSNGASTNWSTPYTPWTIVGIDADGIPDADDDVIIQNSHSISLSATSYCKSLTINIGGTFAPSGKYIFFYGNFTNNGTMSGSILAYFQNTGTISSTSAINFGYLSLSKIITVAAGTTLSGYNYYVLLRGNTTLNNYGTIITAAFNTLGTSGNTVNNYNGASISMKQNVSGVVTLNSSATSLITMGTSVSSLPNWSYNNLTLTGSATTKTTFAALNVSGNLTVNSGVTLAMASNTLNLAGNLSNSGTISGFSTVNLNGTAAQSLSSSSALAIPTLNSTNTNTVTLSTGTYNVSASTSFSNNLTINAGVTLNLGSMPFTIGGNLTNSGTISNPAAVTFNGTTAQTIAFANNLSFTDVVSSNAAGVSITSGNDTITNSLTISSGNLNVGTNLITLKSNATKTAYIANSAGTISGSMIIQRYLAARTASYSDFSSPVASTTIDDWDNELYMTINAPNNVPGYPGGDGMASAPNTFYSVTKYNNTKNWWDSVVTTELLTVGRGYDIWIADDATQFPGRAIDTRGTPNMGTVTYNATYGASTFPGWNLIGNPHASWISWADVVLASPGVSTYIQIYNNGVYVDDLTQPNIAPGQGFFCEVPVGGRTINFPQSAKRALTSSTFLRTSKPKDYDLKLRLSSNANSVYHEININYESGATSKFEQGKDIPFIKSPKQTAPSITFVDGEKKFIRNRINPDENMQILPLEISAPVAGTYNIDLEGLFSNTVYTEAYLLNTATNEQILIDDSRSASIYFEAGQVSKNYSLVLKKSTITNPSVSDDISIFSTSESINIKGNYGDAQTVSVQVYNIVGQLILSKTAELEAKGLITLPTSELNSDVYVVKVITKDNRQYTDKVIVTK